MSACARQLFEGVTAPAWQAIVRAVKDQTGIEITTDDGSASKEGFCVAWRYAPDKGELMVQCMESPWWVPCGLINSKVHDLVDSCQQQVEKQG